MKTNSIKLTGKYSSIALLLLLLNSLNAQQNSLFNTYNLDPLQLNIAYSKPGYSQASLLYKAQWIGMKETPKILQLNAVTDVGKNSALALRIQSQTQGLYNLTGVTFGYSYSFEVSKTARVHAGLGVGLTRAAVKTARAIVIDAGDEATNNVGLQVASGFDSEFGTMYIGPKLKAGVSVLHLYNSNPDFSGSGGYRSLPQFNPQVAYVFMKGEKIELEPCLLLRSTLKGNTSIEGIVNVNFLKDFTAGLGYRQNYGMLVLAGATFGNILAAYSFDYGFGRASRSLGTSHQLLLRFSVKKQEKISSVHRIKSKF